MPTASHSHHTPVDQVNRHIDLSLATYCEDMQNEERAKIRVLSESTMIPMGELEVMIASRAMKAMAVNITGPESYPTLSGRPLREYLEQNHLSSHEALKRIAQAGVTMEDIRLIAKNALAP